MFNSVAEAELKIDRAGASSRSCRRGWRLFVGEDGETGREAERVIQEDFIPVDGLLAHIDQVTRVHHYDGKSAYFAKRGELTNLFKCAAHRISLMDEHGAAAN
jgi:hypothetical protein